MCLSSSCSTGTSPRSENFGAAAFSPSRSMDKTLARAHGLGRTGEAPGKHHCKIRISSEPRGSGTASPPAPPAVVLDQVLGSTKNSARGTDRVSQSIEQGDGGVSGGLSNGGLRAAAH